MMGQHAVRGVADQHGPAAMPAPGLLDDKQAPPLRHPAGGNHLPHRRMPARERREGGTRSRVDDPAPGAGPRRRSFLHRKEVDILAFAADGVVQQVGVRPHPELDREPIGQRRQPLLRYDSAKRAGGGIAHPFGPRDPGAHPRAHAVGADHHIRVDRPAVFKLQGQAGAGLLDRGEAVPEIQPVADEHPAQRTLEVGAVNAEIGCAEGLGVAVSLPDGVGCDDVSGAPVPVDEFARADGGCQHVVEQPEAPQLTRGVGRQRDRRAHLGELGHLLVDFHVNAALA
jgi:hypothetical protein